MEKVITCQAYTLEIITNGKWKKILNNVFFDINKSETLAIVGPSGSGKTMVIRSILSLFEDIEQFRSSGSICFVENDKHYDLTSMDNTELLKFRKDKISFVPQQSTNVLNPSRKIGEELKMSAELTHQKVDISVMTKILEDVGFENPKVILKRYPHELSGGQVQRVLIAAALMKNAALMLVDEPTSNLDVELKFEILNLLSKLKLKFGFTLLIVTHEIDIVNSYCDRLLRVKDGELIEETFDRKISSKTSEEMLASKDHTFVERDADQKNTNLILSAENLHISYPKEQWRMSSDKFEVIKDLDIELYKSEILGIVGPSGSGKSSLAKALCNLIEPTQGTIYYKGVNVLEMSKQEIAEFRKEVQIIFQDPLASLSPHLKVGFLLKEVFMLFGLKPKKEEIEEYIAKFGLEKDILDRKASGMSGGQRQRILIARALIGKPEVLICDEILSSLDSEMQDQIIEMLFNLKRVQDFSLIFISHDISIVDRICDRKILLA